MLRRLVGSPRRVSAVADRRAGRAGPAAPDDPLRWRRRRVTPRSVTPYSMQPVVLLLLVVVLPWLLLETWRSARQERALRAAGAIEPADDVYAWMRCRLPGDVPGDDGGGHRWRRRPARRWSRPASASSSPPSSSSGGRSCRSGGSGASTSWSCLARRWSRAGRIRWLRHPNYVGLLGRDRRRRADDARAVHRRRSRPSSSARCSCSGSASRSGCSGRRRWTEPRDERHWPPPSAPRCHGGCASSTRSPRFGARAARLDRGLRRLPPALRRRAADGAGGVAAARGARPDRRPRHWRWPRPSLASRVVALLRRTWAAPATRVVLPALLASRIMVLAVGFLGVVLIGYPDKSPPFRVSRNEAVNLPVRWDAGWYLGIALNGYDYDPNARATAQQNVAFFPAYPMVVRAVTAWLGGPHHPARRADLRQPRRVAVRDPSHARSRPACSSRSRRSAGGSSISSGWRAISLDDDAAAGAVSLACAWPCAIFYSAFYTEGLFFLVGRRRLVSPARERELARRRDLGARRRAVAAERLPAERAAGGAGAVATGARIWRSDAGTRSAAALARARGGCRAGRRHADLQRLPQRADRAPARVDGSAPGVGPRRHRRRRPLLRARRLIAKQGFYTYSTSQPIELLERDVRHRRRSCWRCRSPAASVSAYAVFLLVMVAPPLLRGGFLSLGRLTSTLFPLFLYLGWRLRGTPRAAVDHRLRRLPGASWRSLFFTWRPFF